MKRIWAPWRMEYITGSLRTEDSTCFLCIDGADDEKALVVERDRNAFIVMNRYPYSNGHLMVVPVRHVGSLEDLSDEELLGMMRLVRRAVSVLKKVMNAQGLNIGINMGKAAGAGLEEHIHIHIVPRWAGDTNFMPVFGETRVISEHLLETYGRLKEGFAEQIF